MGKKSPVTPDQILRNHSAEVQAVAEKLRRIVKNAIPGVTEKAYPGWHGIGYTHPQAGYFCCIFPFEDKVKLAFEFGAFLSDPNSLLVRPATSSKRLRYLEMSDTQDIREDDIVGFLHAAIALKR